MDYDDLILNKIKKTSDSGFECGEIVSPAFDWQKVVIRWACKKGKSAIFAECGLGKTLMQLEWAHQVHKKTGGNVIILAPLSVADQTEREARKFGISVKQVENQYQVESGISITNYEKLEHFDTSLFIGVVLDESSILKSFAGKTRIALTESFSKTNYRLCCTATPSPNDYSEFGQHADFLSVMNSGQMLSTWFINDTANTGDWRLKKHAEMDFWRWVGTWAACVSKPSDIGFDDGDYVLPPLNMKTIVVDVDQTIDAGDELFRHTNLSATTIHKEMRLTSEARAKSLADLVNNSKEQWLIWCNTNDEADHLKKMIPYAIEIRGSDTPKKKKQAPLDFIDGKLRVIISKPSIFGFGLNFQNCSHVGFIGLSYSFEDFYQAIRRSYRFGQKKEVHCYIVQAETEGAILKTIHRKMDQHLNMQEKMKFSANEIKNIQGKKVKMKSDITKHEGDGFTLYNGDCVRVAKTFENESIDFSVFSPPFADLFTYSDDVQDMGNCENEKEFMKQFQFLVDELYRVTVPGRLCAVHCVDLMATKWKDGEIQLKNFSGLIIEAFKDWAYHCRVTIWKDPVIEMQRTKALGLLHKQLCKDSAMSRVGSAEYILVFRKPGKNPKPISHTKEDYPVDLWQRDASPVWMDINQGRVLNRDGAKDHHDEKHICPLQLDVIERCLRLWSTEGDLVFSPFTGIGSEGFCSVKQGRRFVGSELKESYFKQAVQNITKAKAESKTLFDLK